MDNNVFDIRVDQGTSYTFLATWRLDGELVDLTGWSGVMQVRQTPPSETKFLEASTDDGKMVLGADGTITIEFTPEDTGEIDVPTTAPVRLIDSKYYTELGYYDLELTDPDDVVMRLLEGKFYLSREVTR